MYIMKYESTRSEPGFNTRLVNKLLLNFMFECDKDSGAISVCLWKTQPTKVSGLICTAVSDGVKEFKVWLSSLFEFYRNDFHCILLTK